MIFIPCLKVLYLVLGGCPRTILVYTSSRKPCQIANIIDFLNGDPCSYISVNGN